MIIQSQTPKLNLTESLTESFIKSGSPQMKRKDADHIRYP